MNRRRFLALTSAAVAAVMLPVKLKAERKPGLDPATALRDIRASMGLYDIADWGAIPGDASGESMAAATRAITADIDRRRAVGRQPPNVHIRFPSSDDAWFMKEPISVKHCDTTISWHNAYVMWC